MPPIANVTPEENAEILAKRLAAQPPYSRPEIWGGDRSIMGLHDGTKRNPNDNPDAFAN